MLPVPSDPNAAAQQQIQQMQDQVSSSRGLFVIIYYHVIMYLIVKQRPSICYLWIYEGQRHIVLQ